MVCTLFCKSSRIRSEIPAEGVRRLGLLYGPKTSRDRTKFVEEIRMKRGGLSWLKHVGYAVIWYQLETWIKLCQRFDHEAPVFFNNTYGEEGQTARHFNFRGPLRATNVLTLMSDLRPVGLQGWNAPLIFFVTCFLNSSFIQCFSMSHRNVHTHTCPPSMSSTLHTTVGGSPESGRITRGPAPLEPRSSTSSFNSPPQMFSHAFLRWG